MTALVKMCILAKATGIAFRCTQSGQTEQMPVRIAYWISSTVLCRPSVSIRRALWNSAVRREMRRMDAISLAEQPSVTSWRTSRWRSVSSSDQ